MKRFAFSLDRVLGWRRSQARAEETTLERLQTDRRALQSRRSALQEESHREWANSLEKRPVTGSDLEALDRYRKSALLQAGRLDASIAGLNSQIAAQMGVVTERRREVRLLERVRDEKLHKWRLEYGKETDRLAEESHLARWGRL